MADNLMYVLYLIHEDVRNMWVTMGSYKSNYGSYSASSIEVVGVFTSGYEANRLRDEYNAKFEEEEIPSIARVEYFMPNEYSDYSVGVPCTVKASEDKDGIKLEESEDFSKLVPTRDIRKIEEIELHKSIASKDRTFITFTGYNRIKVRRKAKSTMEKLNRVRRTMIELVE